MKTTWLFIFSVIRMIYCAQYSTSSASDQDSIVVQYLVRHVFPPELLDEKIKKEAGDRVLAILRTIQYSEKTPEMQILLVNLLINNYYVFTETALHETTNKLEFGMRLSGISELGRVAYLAEMLSLLKINLKFIPDTKSFYLHMNEDVFEEPSFPVDMNKLNLFIPNHVFMFLDTIKTSEDSILKHCIGMFKALFSLKEAISVHFINDKLFRNISVTSFNFLREICDMGTVSTIELNLSYFVGYNSPSMFQNPRSEFAGLFKASESIDLRFSNLESFKNLKIKSLMTKNIEMDILIPDSLYENLKNLTFVDMSINEIHINWVKKFTSVQNVVFDRCNIPNSYCLQLLELNIPIAFSEVSCKDYAECPDTPELAIFSVNNHSVRSFKLNMSDSRDFSVFINGQISRYGLKSLRLLNVDYFNMVLGFALDNSGLKNLEIRGIIGNMGDKDVYIPWNSTCLSSLKSLKLSILNSRENASLNISNIEKFEILEKLSLDLSSSVKSMEILGLNANSTVLENLDTLDLKVNSNILSKLFNGIQAQVFTLKTLKLQLVDNDDFYFQELLKNPYLQQNVENLQIHVPSNFNGFNFDLKSYQNLKTLDLKIPVGYQQDYLRTLLSYNLFNLETLNLNDWVVLNEDFARLISRITHLKMNNSVSFVEFYENFYKVGKIRACDNRVRKMTIFSSECSSDLIASLKELSKIFPGLECVVLDMSYREKVHWLETLEKSDLNLTYQVI